APTEQQETAPAQNKAQSQQQAAQSQQNPQEQPKAADEEKAKSVRKLIVITLKHRDPQQVQQVFALRNGGLMHGTPGQAPQVVFRGTRTPGQATAAEEEKVAIAISQEEKKLFVRGSDA